MEYRVISADDHIDLRWLPTDLWSTRLPARLRERGPQVMQTENGAYWVCDGQTWGPHGFYTAAQGSGAMWAIERGGVMKEGELRPTTPELRLADMDRDGVDASVMYGPTDPLAVADPELRRACYAAYNDWLIEFCDYKPERLLGVAQLSMEDPRFARDELERLAKAGKLRHFNVLAARAQPPVYDEAWEPFWDLAEDVGIPIGFHLAVVVRRTRLEQPQAPHNPLVASFARSAQNAQGFQLIEPVAGLILTGVLDRHPKLKIVMAEAGLAWVPNMVQSLDRQYKRVSEGRRLVEGTDKLPEQLPSEYFHRQIWITFEDDPFGVKMIGSILDEDKMMWASDYPHPASTWPFSQQVIEEQFRGIDPAIRQKVLVDNARALYGI